MIVYGSTLSPFVRKVLVYGSERGLDMTQKPTAFGKPDPEFEATSPFKKIPGFRDGDFVMSDSTAIIAYLEAKYPDGRLTPTEPAHVGRVTWFEEFADTVAFPPFAKVFFNRVVAPLMGREGDLAVADAAQADELPPMFAYLEGQIDGDYLVGDALSVADIAIASIFVNLVHCGAAPDASAYPTLTAWIGQMHGRPSFAKWIAADTAFLQR